MSIPADLFEPDLIVTTEGGAGWLLVVEAKQAPGDVSKTERQLKQYMLEMRCPVGMLATPRTIRLYHDEYLSTTEDSIRLLGEYAAPAEWCFARESRDSQRVGADFEDAVRHWLEGLTSEEGMRSVPSEFRQVAEGYLISALNQGVVRAARPRMS